MEKVLPSWPISDLRKWQARVLEALDTSPVVLTSKGDPAGVFVKVDQWNQTIDELRRLQRIMKADKDFAEMRAGNFVDMTDEITAKTAA